MDVPFRFSHKRTRVSPGQPRRNTLSKKYTIALPSKGAIAEPTRAFLADCGLKVNKPNERQYVGTIPTLPALNVLFQRVKDVAYKVADGTVQLGITGIDVLHEQDHDTIEIIHDKLGYGHCDLVVAVPESWIDVETMADLVEVSHHFREEKGRNIRIATTYTHSTRKFLHQQGIHHFNLVKAEGAIEAAPTIGYADCIVDLTQTGTTLRENHLKMLRDGVIVRSQACLIGNRIALQNDPNLLEVVRVMTEYIDGALNGRQYYQVTVNIRGNTPEEIAERIIANPITRGLLGPTISPIYGSDLPDGATWHTVTVVVGQKHLLQAMEHLRAAGGKQVIAVPVRYIFLDQSPTFTALVAALGLA